MLALRALVVGILAEEADDAAGKIQDFALAAAGDDAAVHERIAAIVNDAYKVAEKASDDELSDEDDEDELSGEDELAEVDD